MTNTVLAAAPAAAVAAEKQQDILNSDVILHPNLPYTSTTIFAPVGYGPDWGTVYASGGWVNRWPGNSNVSDGYLVLGLGLGDSDRYVGGSVNVLIDSLGMRDERFGQNTAVGGSIYRWLGPNTGIAVGASKFTGSGVFRHSSDGYYGAITQLIPLTPNREFSSPLAVTAGVGTGNFISPFEFRVLRRDDRVSGFGSLSLSPIRQMSVILDYTSEVLSSGISVMPIAWLPAVLTGYATNLTGSRKFDGPVTYGLRLGVGYAFA